jgi:hypothetical protein
VTATLAMSPANAPLYGRMVMAAVTVNHDRHLLSRRATRSAFATPTSSTLADWVLASDR